MKKKKYNNKDLTFLEIQSRWNNLVNKAADMNKREFKKFEARYIKERDYLMKEFEKRYNNKY